MRHDASRYWAVVVTGLLGCAAPLPAATTARPRSPAPVHAEAAATGVSGDAAMAGKIDGVFSAYTEKTPGCAVGVFRAGTVAFSRAYGMADLEHAVPNTVDTVFDIGSTSKQLTAAAIALLVLDGKISLGDDVRRYVPELPDYGTTITLDQLVHHTSGLRDYVSLLTLSGLHTGADLRREDVLALLASQRGLNFTPGTRRLYSSSGYFLLALVVARVSGERFPAFEKERIFAPLAMRDTRVRGWYGEIIDRRAAGYERGPDGAPINALDPHFFAMGAGAVQTTVGDLARWDANFYQPMLGGKAFIEMMRTPGRLSDGSPLDDPYAMGLYLDDENGVARERHGGGCCGYGSQLVRYPTERLTVAVLCNDAAADAEGLADRIARLFLPKLVPTAVLAAVAAPAAHVDLAPFVGTWVDPLTLDVRELRADEGGDGLTLTFGSDAGDPRPLVVVDASTCVVRGTQTRYVLEAATGGNPATLVRTLPNAPATRFARAGATVAASTLAGYAGRFTSDEAWRDLVFAVQDGQLMAGPWGAPLDILLVPIARDVFLGDHGIRFRFERGAAGGIGSVAVDVALAKGVRFTKR